VKLRKIRDVVATGGRIMAWVKDTLDFEWVWRELTESEKEAMKRLEELERKEKL